MKSRYEILAAEKGYYVNSLGDAFSKAGKKVGTRGDDPYMYIGIRINKKKVIKVYIHRLQAYQKYGEKIYQENLEVRHLNGKSLDNSYENISIGTALENCLDKPKHVRLSTSLNAAQYAKVYSDQDVLKMIEMHNNGSSYKEIMNTFGINSKGTMSYLINKRKKYIAG